MPIPIEFDPVSTHARTRRATRIWRGYSGDRRFQLTLARGERLRRISNGLSCSGFQLTLARGERPFASFLGHLPSSFNSRSHAASDCTCRVASAGLSVSTHARTRRATSCRSSRTGCRCFNSRSHAASDASRSAVHSANVFQLTLARGERLRSLETSSPKWRFNSRSHAASDH